MGDILFKKWKTSAVSTTDWMVEAQLCKLGMYKVERKSCKKTRRFIDASWRKTSPECSTHAVMAGEAFVHPMERIGNDGWSKILANAASLFSFSISLVRSCCCVQLFLDDGTDVPDKCRIHRCCCCCCSLTTAKRCRSCWSTSREVGDVILWVCWVLGCCCGRLKTSSIRTFSTADLQ